MKYKMTDQEEQELVIKDKKYVLHYDLVNIDKFNPNLLRVAGYHRLCHDVYNISYFVKGYEEVDTSNFPFLLHIKENVVRFFETFKGEKYLTIARTSNNRSFLNKYNEIWTEIVKKK